MKRNWLPELEGAQTNGVIANGVLLTLRIRSSKRVPIPLSGVMVPMKAGAQLSQSFSSFEVF